MCSGRHERKNDSGQMPGVLFPVKHAFTCTQNRPATPASSDVATMTYCPCGSARRQETSRRGTKGRERCFVSACGDNKDNNNIMARHGAAWRRWEWGTTGPEGRGQ
ncbi:unnamed protein product, partial [Ectocarpus sp. 12 AP-2014]